ncbi:hypothetical protein HY523_01415 [Candidatus Berkelbacteria bacterium]|nr:hypothetical protein [Candidatus Berkelbacteria bacterium]
MASYLFCLGPKADPRPLFARWLSKLAIHPADQVWLERDNGRLLIDAVRSFQREMHCKPFTSPFRVGLISGADTLTPEAAHALLKLLEDPPPHALFLLAAADETAVLPTIVSRCQRWHLAASPSSEVPNATIPSMTALQRLSYRERLRLAETWAKDDQSIQYLDQLLMEARHSMLNGQLAPGVVEEFLYYRTLLATNASPRLIFDNCLLALEGER